MMRRVSFYGLFFFVLVSCVTVNIYFPAAAVQKAADSIVEDVRQEEGKQITPKEPKHDKGSYLIQEFRKFALGPSDAFAQINVDVSTPAIRALKQSMRDRFPQIRPFLERGAAGENNNGFIEIRDSAGLNLKEQSDLNRLISQENSDRKSLYTEIMKANRFGPEVLPQIQKIFANSWRSSAQGNWWIQNDNGTWEKKK